MLYDCEIKFKDSKKSFCSLIKIGSVGKNDNDIFFYCENEEDFKALSNEDNGEDFVVLSFEKI